MTEERKMRRALAETARRAAARPITRCSGRWCWHEGGWHPFCPPRRPQHCLERRRQARWQEMPPAGAASSTAAHHEAAVFQAAAADPPSPYGLADEDP